MKQTVMLVVSLRGVNFGILVSLRVFRAKRQYFMHACIGYDDHVFISLKPAHCMLYLCVFKWSPLGVKICLSHTQIGLLQASQKTRATPRCSPLGVKLKIHMGVPLRLNYRLISTIGYLQRLFIHKKITPARLACLCFLFSATVWLPKGIVNYIDLHGKKTRINMNLHYSGDEVESSLHIHIARKQANNQYYNNDLLKSQMEQLLKCIVSHNFAF